MASRSNAPLVLSGSTNPALLFPSLLFVLFALLTPGPAPPALLLLILLLLLLQLLPLLLLPSSSSGSSSLSSYSSFLPSSFCSPSPPSRPSSPLFVSIPSSPPSSPPPSSSSYPLSAFSLPPPPPSSTPPSAPSAPPSSRSPSASSLKVLQWNAGGIRSHKAELGNLLSSLSPDLVLIQETGLSSSHTFSIPNYSCVRADRTVARGRGRDGATHHCGGGVLTLIKRGIPYTEQSSSRFSSIDPFSDFLLLDVHLNNSTYSFLNVYSPPIRPSSLDCRTPSFQPSLLPSSRSTFIFGDFNVHHPLWDSFLPSDPMGRSLADWISASDLSVLNDPLTFTRFSPSSASQSSPDLSLAPSHLAGACTWETLDPLGSDHLPILALLPLSAPAPPLRPPSFNFKKADWSLFQSKLSSALSSCPSPSTSAFIPFFTSSILSSAKASIPFGRVNKGPKAWWSDEVETAVRDRKAAFQRLAARPSSPSRIEDYQTCAATARTTIAAAKAKSWETLASSLSPSKPGPTFRILRSVSGLSSANSSDSSIDGATSAKGKAQKIANFYSSHFSRPVPKSHRPKDRKFIKEVRLNSCSHPSNFCSDFSLSELSAALSNLSDSIAVDPSGLSYPLLRHLPDSALTLLLHLFNHLWSTSSFPSAWKLSRIIPLLKAGKSPTSSSSYRPISLTSCLARLFEKMILKRLLFYAEERNLLSNFQAGFRPGRSTLDQVLLLSQSIADGFHRTKPADRSVLASIDFSRAFDSVWHRGLLSKLSSLGFPPCFVRWVRSYLADRRAEVVFDSCPSKSFRLRYGVPQGSVLGPLLFLLFINDLPSIFPSSVQYSLYADDLAIWSSSSDVGVAAASVQCALDGLSLWSSDWLMSVNVSKCTASLFSTDPRQSKTQVSLFLNSEPLPFNPSPVFLGVKFDRTLSFSSHVSMVQAKAAPRIRALKCIASKSWGPSKESLSQLYTSFVRPVLTYASPAWAPFAPKSILKPLSVLHNRACRVVSGCLSSTPLPSLYAESGLPPLFLNFRLSALSFYERALRLPPSFPISGVAKAKPRQRLKRTTSWRSFCATHSALDPSLTRSDLCLVAPFPPWRSFSRLTFACDLDLPCSASYPPLLKARIFDMSLANLPPADIDIWTDGSVSGPSGRGGAGVITSCKKCLTSCSLSFAAGVHCSSFRSELIAIQEALWWVVGHRRSCQVSRVHLFSDSLSSISFLSPGPTVLLEDVPHSIWSAVLALDLTGIGVHFQWTPAHCGVLGNEMADDLAKNGAALKQDGIPISYSSSLCLIKSRFFKTWWDHLPSPLLACRFPKIDKSERLLPRSVRCELSRLRSNGHSLLLSSYLHRIGRSPSSSCPECGYHNQDVVHLLLHCPNLDLLRFRIFGQSPSLSDLWSRPWGVARLLGLGGTAAVMAAPPPNPEVGTG